MRALLLSLAVLAASSAAQERPPLPADTLPAELFPDPPPEGIPPPPAPRTSPMTRLGFDLGRKLFFDPILSVDRTVSCASCHQPDHAFASPEALPLGVHGNHAERNSPTLLNRAFGIAQGWTGAARSLEEQVLLPISNPSEMGLPLDEAVGRLREQPDYRRAFDLAYADGVNDTNLAQALGTFVRGLLHGNTVVDRFQAGQIDSLSAKEKAGLWLFESKAKCWRCHSGRNFTDERLHNTGIGVVDGVPADGRFSVTGDDTDRGRFKTPTLRALRLTAPYMHDGSIATLGDVVDYYRAGANANPWLDHRVVPLALTDLERDQLVAFLLALSKTE